MSNYYPMQLHTLTTYRKRKDKKRIGHGGKRGTTSGKGTKGQKSRSGHKIRPAQRDLIQRLPKFRGVKNKPLAAAPVAINLSQLSRVTDAIITRDALLRAGLIRASEVSIKILGSGSVTRPLTIQGLSISESAKEKIEKAGGQIVASSK